MADAEPRRVAPHQERGDAAVAGRGVDGGKDDEEPASAALVIQSLRPLRTKPSPSATALVVSANASLPEPASDKA